MAVCWDHEGGLFKGKGCLECDRMCKRTWWIACAVVNPPHMRNKGIGSRLMGILIEALSKKDCSRVIVMPGGYDSDQKKQFKFYEKTDSGTRGEATSLVVVFRCGKPW